MKKLSPKKYNYIFFSPHLDDVVLSCGGLIAKLKKEKVLIVTIFSDYQGQKYSKHARCYLEHLKFIDAKDYFNTRKKEERTAAKFLNYDFEWLDFPEAIFRFNKCLLFTNYFYNSTKKLLGLVYKKDKNILFLIREKIEIILKNKSNNESKIYFPLGIGNHVDHQILHEIGLSFLKKRFKKIYFYEDFPYVIKTKKFKLKGLCFKKEMLSKRNLETKLTAILSYKSQINILFKGVLDFKQQFFNFHKKNYEKYWYFPRS